jgi:hypothetical protein
MRRGAPAAAAVFLACAVVGGCQCHDPTRLVGTAFYVHVDFDDGLGLTQLRFIGSSGGQGIFDTTLPSTAAGTLISEQTVRIELADRLDGSTVNLEVIGLEGGSSVASGFAAQQVVKGVEVDVYVTLGGGDAGTCGACPGCCSGTRCVAQTSFSACGSGGAVCAPCDPLLADSCDAGACGCGQGPACERARGSDRCDGGICACGAGTVCAPGLECDGGSCQCTPASCPSGCCDPSDQCVNPSFSACGIGGAACVRCNAFLADACLGGACQCGADTPCDAGTECLSHQCQCTAASCPGCCSGTACETGTSTAACGSGGAACLACTGSQACQNGTCASGSTCGTCSALTSNGCTDAGICTCDGGPACDAIAAQWCSGGVCTCHPAACGGGCCLGAICEDGGFPNCGTQGASCIVCDPARSNGCLGGSCACGGGAACAPALGSDTCNNGVCMCGGSAACANGLTCDAGTCACTPESCSGCCKNNVCQPGTSKNACGVGGVTCEQCTAQLKCDAGVCA